MFDLIGKKKIFFTISILFIIAGIIALFVQGFNFDIQFQGGTILEIPMKDANFDINKAVTVAKEATGKLVSAQISSPVDTEHNNERINMLVLSVSSSEFLTEEEHENLVSAIKKNFEVKENADITTRHVDPAMGKELAAKSILAVVIASILMLLYVWIRFNVMGGLLAGLASVIALVHDVAVMLAFYAITDLPVNESFIAAMLMIVGYSINDTIIVFDRIRENSTLLRKDSLTTITNKSIKQTLSRTIVTSLTTIACVLTVYIFASINDIDSIKNFMLPILVGLVSGTYSSVFIASPVWVMMKERQVKKESASKPAKA